MIQNGNFNDISIKEARAICDNLQIGDTIILDERMMNSRYQNDKFFFTQNSDNDVDNREFYTNGQYTKHIRRVLPDGRTKVLDTSPEDCSIRVALKDDDAIWISYGCINYLETKKANKKQSLPPKQVIEVVEETDEVRDLKILDNTDKEMNNDKNNELKRLKADNDVLKATLELADEENKKLQQEVNELKKGMVLANIDNVNSLIKTLVRKCGGIRGTKWTKEEETVVVVQTDAELYMVIDTKTFDRYYEEALSEDQVIKELIARGWQLDDTSLKES